MILLGRRRSLLVLGVLLAVALAARLPILVNADANLTSDEAANALGLVHLLRGEEWLAAGWDAHYYGIVEGLISAPAVLALGPRPVAFKLGAVGGFMLLVVAVFALGRELFGDREGLAAAALLVVFSPQLLWWSTLAVSGFCLVVAWGTLTFLWISRLAARSTLDHWFVLGFLVGFGFYIFELYLPYALLGLTGAAVLLAHRSLGALRRWCSLAALVAGLVVGALPKVIVLLTESQKRPDYSLADFDRLRGNLALFTRACAPALFGVNLRPTAPLVDGVGPSLGLAGSVLGGVLVAGYTASWFRGAFETARLARGGTSQRSKRLVVGLLVALVPLMTVLFLFSRNPQDVGSNRYLLPWLSALPLAGSAIVSLGRRSAVLATTALVLGIGLPAIQAASWFVDRGELTDRLALRRRPEPLVPLIGELSGRGYRGAYSRYWDAYKATLLGEEKLLVVPYLGWDRHPKYSRALAEAQRVVWFFPSESLPLRPLAHLDAQRLEALLKNQLASAGLPFRMERIAGYRVYAAPDGGRLLPAPRVGLRPVALTRPRVTYLAASLPSAAEEATEFVARLRLRNDSDGPWSVAGLPLEAGRFRVTASYRWLADGGDVVIAEGERSLLPTDVEVGQEIRMNVRVAVPRLPGTATLRLTMVQEGQAWFADVGGGHLDRRVRIAPSPAHGPAR